MKNNNHVGHRYFVYVRTWRGEGQGANLPDQLADLANAIEQRKLQVVDTFEESKSAKQEERPAFNEMIRRIEAGDANGIIAQCPDQLTRNTNDAGRLMTLMDTGKLADLQFQAYGFENTSQGRTALSLFFRFGKPYSDHLSQLIIRGKRRPSAEVHAPIGYRNDDDLGRMVPDPVQGPLVRRSLKLYARGAVAFKSSLKALGRTGPKNKRREPRQD